MAGRRRGACITSHDWPCGRVDSYDGPLFVPALAFPPAHPFGVRAHGMKGVHISSFAQVWT